MAQLPGKGVVEWTGLERHVSDLDRVQPIRYFTHMRIETRLNGGQFVWKWHSGWLSLAT